VAAALIYVPAFHLVDSALHRRRIARQERTETPE
jgi:hypothetical protein